MAKFSIEISDDLFGWMMGYVAARRLKEKNTFNRTDYVRGLIVKSQEEEETKHETIRKPNRRRADPINRTKVPHRDSGAG